MRSYILATFLGICFIPLPQANYIANTFIDKMAAVILTYSIP